MMRIKIPGGVLTPEQTKVIGKIAADFARGPIPNPHFGNNFLDLTTRQDVQMHWLKMENVPEIWRRLEEVGITTVQACGDSARNVLCCPVSGLDHLEVIDAFPVAQAISAYFTGNREYANLPRKFKMSVTGCLEDCAQAEINDVGMLPARLEGGALGFNLRVGGGLSDGPRMASDIDVFVRPEEAVEITRGIAQVFGELGNRENRWTARMRYLVQELGPEGFREELEKRVSVDLIPAGEDLTKRYRGDHVGVHPQKEDGSRTAPTFYVGQNVPVGRMSGEQFEEAGRLAGEYGHGVRLATDQNLGITGVPEERLDDLLAEPLLERYSPNPGAFERGVVACTGSEFCRFGIVETKVRAVEWAREMDERVGDLGQEAVRMHFSGCSASCAQPQIGDIGFRGETAKTREAIVEGVDIGLGGSLGKDAAFIDWVEGAKPAEEVPDALVAVFEKFEEERREGERFHEWARRMRNAELREALRKPLRSGVSA
jgi:ferredoxin-nitrite reductase